MIPLKLSYKPGNVKFLAVFAISIFWCIFIRVSQVAPSEANRNLFESLKLQEQLLWVKNGQNFMLRAVKNVYSRFWPILTGFLIFLAKFFESSFNFLLNDYRRTSEKLIRYCKYYEKLDAIKIKFLNMLKRYKKCSKIIIFIFLLWSFKL